MNPTNTTITTAALAALCVACGSQPTDEEYDDVATGVAALVQENPGSETEAIRDAVDAATGEVPAGLSREGMGTLTGQRGAVSYDFALTCQDVDGATLTPCDERTDAARLVVDVEGTLDTARYAAAFTRTGDWQLTGLTGATATLEGSGTFDLQSEFQALYREEMRTFVLDYDARYEGVRIRTADGAPVGGTITYDVHATRTRTRAFRDVEREIDVSAVVTFDESGTATLTLDGARRYEIQGNGGVTRAD